MQRASFSASSRTVIDHLDRGEVSSPDGEIAVSPWEDWFLAVRTGACALGRSPASASICRSVNSGLGSWSAVASTRAFAPNSCHRSLAAQARSIAAANDVRVVASATNPFRGSETHSALPPTSVTTAGRPQIIASTRVIGVPSQREGSTSRWLSFQIPRTSDAWPRNSTWSAIP